jgi:hypothetical protein
VGDAVGADAQARLLICVARRFPHRRAGAAREFLKKPVEASGGGNALRERQGCG